MPAFMQPGGLPESSRWSQPAKTTGIPKDEPHPEGVPEHPTLQKVFLLEVYSSLTKQFSELLKK